MYGWAMSGTVPPAQFQDLIDTLAATTGAPATLEDLDLNLVASSGHKEVIDAIRQDTILRRRSDAAVQDFFAAHGIARAEEPLRIPGDSVVGRLSRWCLPVRWGGATYGYLWLLDPDERVSREVLRDLDDLVEQVAVAMALRVRISDRTSWAVGELLSEDPGVRSRGLKELRLNSLFPHDSIVVAALAPREGGPVGSLTVWLPPKAVLVTTMGHRVALVFQVPDLRVATDITERAAGSLLVQHSLGVGAGVSEPTAVTDGHAGWHQAKTALRAALHTSEKVGAVSVRTWERLGVLRLLALAEAPTLAAMVADDAARRLLAGDKDLLLTARTYLDHSGSAQRTAAKLSIHRQTLYTRLRRIAETTGCDLEDGSNRLSLHLALTLAALND